MALHDIIVKCIYFHFHFQSHVFRRSRSSESLTNEQVEREESAENNENDKENIVPHGLFIARLLVDVCNINCIVHDVHPTLEGGDLKQGEEANHRVIECDFAIHPAVSTVCNCFQVQAYFPKNLVSFRIRSRVLGSRWITTVSLFR